MNLRMLPLMALILLLTSCLPTGGGDTAEASCNPGFEFDPVRRTCAAAVLADGVPVGTTTSTTIVENSGANNIPLAFDDSTNDPALSCTLTSLGSSLDDVPATCNCISGSCQANITPDTNFSGISDFSYTITDKDGTSKATLVTVTVTNINNTPVATSGAVITSENLPTTFNFSGLVSDADGTNSNISIITQPASGVITPTVGTTLTTFTFTPNTDVNDESALAQATYGGMRYLIDPDFNSSTASMTVQYIPSGSLGIVTMTGSFLSINVIDGVTTDAEVKALLDANPTIDTVVGIQYEILGSQPINLGGATQNIILNNGRDLPDSLTYRAIDGLDTSLTADSSVNITVNPLPSTPTPDPLSTLSSPVTINEDDVAATFTLPYATTPDHFVDLVNQGLNFARLTETNATISNCLGLAGSEAALGGVHDLTCQLSAAANMSSDDTHAAAIIGGLRWRALKAGTAGNNISVQYLDVPSIGSVTISGFPGLNIVIQFDSAVHSSFDIKSAMDALIATAGRPLATPDDFDIEVVMLGSIAEAAIGPISFSGGREFAATMQYQVNGLASQTQNVNFNITPVSDNPVAAADQAHPTVQEDTLYSFTATRGSDGDVRDNLSYIIDETGLQGDVQNCMGQNGSDASDLTCDFMPNADYAGVTTFTYQTSDGTNLSAATTVTFTVNAVQDPPVVCDYAHFSEAVECGENGCIAAQSPIGNITPTASGIRYYDSAAGTCYISDTSLTDNWRKLDQTSSADQLLLIPAQTVNEKETIVINQIRLDEGGNDTTENNEVLQITALSSSDPILIPTGNIRFYYDANNDGTEEEITSALPIALGDAANSADFKDLRIEVTPTGGQAGSSTISLTIADDSLPTAKTTPVQFVVTVNPVSAQHGGWKNIKAIGPKTNKFGQIRDSLNACSYSRSQCNGECTGGASPLNNITPSTTNILYFDSAANKCYHLPDAATPSSSNWVELNTVCQVSSSIAEPACSGLKGSCIGSGAPTLTATKLNSFYYDLTNNKCYRSTGTGAPSWQEYTATSETTIEWNNFAVSSGGAITGYNVYRRLGMAGNDFDYQSPINKTLISVTENKFVDNATNSYFAPVPQTVYFYEVRPVVNGLSTATSEVFKTIRLMSPPNNKTFVHRWMVNQNICSIMQAGDIDPTNNYRCRYEGPGDTGLAGDNYYDIGSDLIVDRYEAGCAYTGAPACNTADGSCIGIGHPGPAGIDADNGAVSVGDIYYDRGSGICYRNTAPDTWVEMDLAAAVFTNHSVAELPPLANIKQENADVFCRDASHNLTDTDILGLATATTITSQLPTRKMQVAYSQWDPNVTDVSINEYETGLSINVSSKCNTFSASGLTSSYTDTQTPSSSDLFSLPGTATSGIRSFMTGSADLGFSRGTQLNCSSRYGVQDAVGNVKEWVAERLHCGFGDFTCQGMAAVDTGVPETWAAQVTALPSISNDTRPGTGGDDYAIFRLDDRVGPCGDTGDDGTCDTFIESWPIDQKLNDATRWAIPMGLPVHSGFNVTSFPSSEVATYMKEIGNTAGITDAQLHEDEIEINNNFIRADENACGAMAAGGSYLDGNGAGAWSFEYTQCSDINFGHLVSGGYYFRAKAAGVSITIQSAGGTNQPFAMRTSNVGSGDPVTDANALVVLLATGPSGELITTASDFLTQMQTDPTATTLMDTFVIGSVTSPTTTLTKSSLDNQTSYAKRSDIGFRCVVPVGNAAYAQ